MMAERVGFEPTEPVKVQRFSRPPLSTTQPPLLQSHREAVRGRFTIYNLQSYALISSIPLMYGRSA